MINIYSRRSFLERLMISGAAGGLASLLNVPPFVRKALAEGSIGTNGKKLIFLWLRFGSDGLNIVIPSIDRTYSAQRSTIYQSRVGQTAPDNTVDPQGGLSNYNVAGAYGTNGGLNKMFDATQFTTLTSTARTSADDVYAFTDAIPAGNGFGGFHSRMKFIAPVFNDGDMAIVQRTGYPFLSRSHFDSQRYWENGRPVTPSDKTGNVLNEGILYRTMAEAITADPLGVGTRALTGVSLQSALPLLLRGSKYAMTNLSDPLRYSLLGVPNQLAGEERAQLTNALKTASAVAFPGKSSNREILDLNFSGLTNTLETFAEIDFSTAGARNYFDDIATDADTEWYGSTVPVDGVTKPANQGYYLFPTSNDTNGGWRRPSGTTVGNKYVIPANTYGFTNQVRNTALTALFTNATILGTEIGGWDNHNNQVTAASPDAGTHANLISQVGWAFYALKRFFQKYGVGGTAPAAGATCGWNDVVIVAFSEFGRTSAQNNNTGTDHAEGGPIYVAGGAVNGGLKCWHNSVDTPGGPNAPALVSRYQLGTGGQNGTMFGASARYLQRCVDYRSVFGEIIRDHLGATQNQLNRILPGYANEGLYKLKDGGVQEDGVGVTGELGLV
jgi:uncharacterized protein (DUF1501 family)